MYEFTKDRVEDFETIEKMLSELQSIGQSIGKMQMMLCRCRRTDTQKFMDYEKRLADLQNQHCDYVSFIKFVTRYYMVPETLE